MVLGHEAPETGVGGIVTVVAHHEIVVHRESVVGGHLPVNQHFAVLHLQVVAFVIADDLVVKDDVLGRNLHRHALLRDGERTEEILVPAVVAVVREDVGIVFAIIVLPHLHLVTLLLNKILLLGIKPEQEVVDVDLLHILFVDVQRLALLLGELQS